MDKSGRNPAPKPEKKQIKNEKKLRKPKGKAGKAKKREPKKKAENKKILEQPGHPHGMAEGKKAGRGEKNAQNSLTL
mgnify:CR=1 FL=1